MVVYKRASTTRELNQILSLQQRNLPSNLSSEERTKEGFVTVSHSLEILMKMNDVCPHVIAKDLDSVVGYALCMHPEFAGEVEVLKPMFSQLNSVLRKTERYMVVGQICIAKEYRKKGVFKGMYSFYKKELHKDFDCLITEVVSNNIRSLDAHRTVGFETIKTYQADGISWEVIKWDWN